MEGRSDAHQPAIGLAREAICSSLWEGLVEGLRSNNISIYWRWRQRYVHDDEYGP